MLTKIQKLVKAKIKADQKIKVKEDLSFKALIITHNSKT